MEKVRDFEEESSYYGKTESKQLYKQKYKLYSYLLLLIC